MSTYREMIDEILDLASHDAGDEFEGMIKAAINRTYRQVLQQANQETERREFSLTTASGTSQYGMPLYVKRVLNIEDAVNRRSIYDISARTFDSQYAGHSDTGDPWRAYMLGKYGCEAQPSSASVITVVSDNTGDTATSYITVTGFVSGELQQETITLTGTTAAAGTKSFTAIERIVKHSDSGITIDGTITVSSNSAAVTNAVITPQYTSPTHLWFEFHPTPDAARTYTVRSDMRKPDLSADSDWPEIDEDFHSAIVWGAGAQCLPNAGKGAQADRLSSNYHRAMKQIRGVEDDHPNRMRVFADVHSVESFSRRPLVSGIDY
jgi:hypothetical protein